MSEDQVSKLEKLEKRRQQLAKWKSKKIAGVKAETISLATESEKLVESEKSTEELKKIERQKKLEEWKRRKQQQVKSVSPENTDKPGKFHDLEQDKQDKQMRLDAWKKRKIGSETAIKIVPTVKLKSTKRDIHKKSIFLEDEDESLETRVKPNFKAPLGPSVAKSNYNRADDKQATKNRSLVDQDNKDELDQFLESLKVTEYTTNGSEISHMPISNINNPLIGSDLTHLDNSDSSGEDEESRLISEKIKNIGKGKELVQVDHEQIEYATFRKTFYTEAASIKSLSEEEVKALRLEMDGIKVTGKDVPRPIWEWSQLGLSSLVLSVMEEKLSYTKPTSIQSQALPSIMSGRDFMGVAKTGSGKTLAFVLPLLSHVQNQPPLAKGEGPIAILLTPTRELALQIYKQLCYFTKKLSISACCCYGGSSIEPQIAELKKGSQVVVATPGRLIDLLAANNGRVCNLRRVTYIVLDEADRMFDFGFEPQVQKIFSQIRPDRQSILFSATFAKKMESLARAILHNPVEVVVGGISVVAPEITQHVEFFDVTDELPEEIFRKKLRMLLHVLSQYPHVKKLVFVEKQDSADSLLVKLLAEKVPCVAIHGGKEQIDRKYAIREFSSKDSAVDVLIATSIAARGLDVKGLDLVVNFDPANHMEDYVHRVGRTGRAGNHGDAYTFVTSDQERPITDLVKALRLSKVPETDINPKLIHICNNFLEKVKAGKKKFRFGFGGNGLSKLDESRDSAKVLERKAYDVGSEPKKTHNKNTTDKPILEAALDLPEFKVIEGRAEETAGPDKCKFHSRVTINDLPQKARWIVVNADNLAQIIEATSTSITNKGQYYAPKTKIPVTIKQGGRDVPAPPKLYLLIEGLTEAAVSEANRMIRQKMIEGLNQASADESSAAPGKYTV